MLSPPDGLVEDTPPCGQGFAQGFVKARGGVARSTDAYSIDLQYVSFGRTTVAVLPAGRASHHWPEPILNISAPWRSRDARAQKGQVGLRAVRPGYRSVSIQQMELKVPC